jgi:DNA-binding transcriptional ArsR family regulator
MQDNITRILKAIADPTRREIFHALVVAATALPITQIADQFEISRQGVTKHIGILEAAGLVRSSTLGRERVCEYNAVPLKELNKWLSFYEKFWDNAIGNLGDYLDGKI